MYFKTYFQILLVHEELFKCPYPKLKDFKRIFDHRVDQEYSGIYCNLKLEKSSFIEFITAALNKTDVLKVGQLTNLSIVFTPTCAQARARLPIISYYAVPAGAPSFRSLLLLVPVTEKLVDRLVCKGLLKISLFKIFQPPFCLASQCRQISCPQESTGFS